MLKSCTHFGMPAFSWGENGKRYMYNPKVEGSFERARGLAEADGKREKAIEKAEKKAAKK